MDVYVEVSAPSQQRPYHLASRQTFLTLEMTAKRGEMAEKCSGNGRMSEHDWISAESIPTLKNRESIHFGFWLRGFVKKELIHDTRIDS